MTVTWSQDAQNDLIEAETFLLEHNPGAAEKMMRAAVAASGFMEQHPLAGPPVPGRDLRKWHVAQTRYILLYRVRGRNVRIVRVMHDARNWIRFL